MLRAARRCVYRIDEPTTFRRRRAAPCTASEFSACRAPDSCMVRTSTTTRARSDRASAATAVHASQQPRTCAPLHSVAAMRRRRWPSRAPDATSIQLFSDPRSPDCSSADANAFSRRCAALCATSEFSACRAPLSTRLRSATSSRARADCTFAAAAAQVMSTPRTCIPPHSIATMRRRTRAWRAPFLAAIQLFSDRRKQTCCSAATAFSTKACAESLRFAVDTQSTSDFFRSEATINCSIRSHDILLCLFSSARSHQVIIASRCWPRSQSCTTLAISLRAS